MFLKNLIITLGCFCLPLALNAQNWDWVRTLKGGKHHYCFDLDIDKDGNILVAGIAKGVGVFDDISNELTPPIVGSSDSYTAKFSPEGKLLWANRDGGLIEDWGTAVTADDEANVYTTGFYKDSMSFGENYVSGFESGISNIFIHKINSLGERQWIRAGNGLEGVSRGLDIASTKDGNIISTGWIDDKVVFEQDTLGIVGDISGYCVNYDKNGNLNWGIDFGMPSAGLAIATNNENEIIIGGYFGRQLTSRGILLNKYSSSGALIWSKMDNSPYLDVINSVKITDNQSIYIGGIFSDTISLDSQTIVSDFIEDGFLGKLDQNGKTLWLKKAITNDSMFNFYDMEVFDNNILVSGRFWGGLYFENDTLISQGSGDGFLANFDTLGQFRWVKQFGSKPINDCGGKCSDGIQAIGLDKDFNLYAGGYFRDAVYFDSLLVEPVSNTESFFAKIYLPITAEIESVKTSCESDSLLFLAKGYGSPLTYEWSFPFAEQDFFTQHNPNVVYQNEGIYSASLIISNKYQSDTVEINESIIINSTPIISLGRDTIICENDSIELFVGANFNTYLWNDGSTEPSLFVDTAGVYFLQVTTGEGCIGSDTIEITKKPCTNNLSANLNSFQYSIFPNPVQENLIFASNKSGSTMRIFTVMGTECYNVSGLGYGENLLDLKTLPVGIYFYKIETPDHPIVTGRLVKQ